jgi:hypothetical protein
LQFFHPHRCPVTTLSPSPDLGLTRPGHGICCPQTDPGVPRLISPISFQPSLVCPVGSGPASSRCPPSTGTRPDRFTITRSHVTRPGPTDACRIRCPGPVPSKHSGGHSTMPALTPGCRRPLPTAVAVRVPLPGPGAAAGPWRCHCHCLFAPSSVRPPELPPQCVALAPDSGLPQPLASDRSSSMPLPAPARLRSRGLAAATAFSLRAASDRPSYRHSARLFAS